MTNIQESTVLFRKDAYRASQGSIDGAVLEALDTSYGASRTEHGYKRESRNDFVQSAYVSIT